jgi:hypothetical protein
MVRSDSVFSSGSMQGLLTLVILSGIALAISIQPPARIAAADASDLSYLPSLFPLVAVFLFGAFAVGRGALIALNASTRRLGFKQGRLFAEHILCGLLLVIPYFLFSRPIVPTRGAGVALLVLYLALSAVFFGLVSFRLEVRSSQTKRGTFLLRYGIYLTFCAVPLGIGMSSRALSIVLSLSPIGSAMQIARGASAGALSISFLVPFVGIVLTLARLRRIERRPHAI